MSTLRVDETEVLIDVPAVTALEVDANRWRPAPDAVRLVASAGRAAVVLLAVLVPSAASRPLTATALASTVLVATVWVLALRCAFALKLGALGVGPSAVIGTSAGLAVVTALRSALPEYQPTAAELVGTAAGVFATAFVWECFVRCTSAGRKRILVVGTPEQSEIVAAELDRAGTHEFELVGRVGDGHDGATGSGVPLAGGLADLADVVEAQRPELVVLMDEHTYGRAVDRLLDYPGTNARVIDLAGFFEYALGRVPVCQLTPTWFMRLVHFRQPVYGRWTKRAFDVVCACLGLLLALPAIGVTALVVGCTRGPLLYRQTRLGEGGRPFTIYKFRTMVVDAERAGQPCFACENDPRVIPGGRLIRRIHLDELPQLWNVLRGDMSIVGPRPERPECALRLERDVPFWNRRLLVKPGITGWAQVRCGYVSDYDEMAEKLAYDLWYLRNRSLLLDLAICLRTIGLQLGAMVPHSRAGTLAR